MLLCPSTDSTFGVSVIVPNYNGGRLIPGCLKALQRQTFKDFEVLIVDNGSMDDSVHVIRTILETTANPPVVRLISLNRNLGFCGGILEGLRHARAEKIALLNNDAEPDEKWLEEMASAMDRDPEVGICASKLIVHGTNFIDSAGDIFSNCLKGFKRGEGKKIVAYDKEEYIFGACAGAALYRRKMIDEIGFLDEDFFLVQEDTDLNIRAHLYGWKVLYVPTAIVYHYVSSSIGRGTPKAIYYALRNVEFVRIKNVPLKIFLKCFPEFFIWMVFEFLYFAVKHKHFKLYFSAKRDVLKKLRVMLMKRKLIMKGNKNNGKYLLQVMTPIFQKDFLRIKLRKFLFR